MTFIGLLILGFGFFHLCLSLLIARIFVRLLSFLPKRGQVKAQ